MLRFALLTCILVAPLARPAFADVLIGVAGPASGPQAAAAEDIARAVRLAAQRLNAQGGVHGETVQVIGADDGCSANEAEAAAGTFVARGVALVVGHPCAGAAIAAAKVYAQAGVVFIAPATRHPALTDARAGPTVFRLSGRDDRQGAAAGAYLARAFPGKPLAVFRDYSLYATLLADDALAALKAAGADNVITAVVKGGQKDYAALVKTLKDARTQALLFTGYPIEGGLLLRQMRAAGLSTAFIGGDVLATAQFAETAGEDAGGTTALLPHDGTRAIASETLRKRFAPDPVSGPFLSAYAAVEAWASAVRQTQAADGEAVSSALHTGAFQTVLGRVSFDAKGDGDVPAYDIVWWKDDAWRRKDQGPK